MSKSNAWENDILALLFNATAIANIADNAASSPLTNLYVALHTADPGEGGNQSTNEANYGDYARVAVGRNSGAWTVSGGAATNIAAIVFPEASSGVNAITHASVGVGSSGATKMLYKGALVTPLNVSTGIEPRFEAGELDVTED